jgi:hypothetical protein
MVHPARVVEAVMYRQRIRQEVLYGQFREYLEVAEELMARRQELGLVAPRLWAPVVGRGNEIVWELDYADLATFERETTAFYGDTDAMRHWRALWQLAVQGSTHDELLQEAPRIA